MHGATLVTAGVYILLRISSIIEYSKISIIIITIIGGLTLILGGIIGLMQKDIKRIIAYSTMSQLGYMVISIGISEYNLTMYHMINHGYYKALLFLSVGSIIKNMKEEQDIRKLGGLIKILPLTYTLMFIGSMSLIGLPYMSGNYSKEKILELAYTKNSI